MSGDPEGVVEFRAGGDKYRLFFGMRAQKAVEQHYDLPFFRALQRVMPQLSAEDMADKAKVAEASASLRFTDVAKLFEFGLAKHHDLSETDVEDLIDTIGLARTTELMGEALKAALGDGEEEGPNPPQASRKKKTGSPALQNG